MRLEGVDSEREKWMMTLIVPLLNLLIISRTQNDAAAATDTSNATVAILIIDNCNTSSCQGHKTMLQNTFIAKFKFLAFVVRRMDLCQGAALMPGS